MRPALRARFDQEYLRRYGHANPAADVEIVVLHSLATLHMKRPEIARLAGAGDRPGVPRNRARGRSSSWRRIASCRRRSMIAMRSGRDFAGTGPALIVEYGSSTLIGPRDSFTIGKLGEIDIDCNH